MSTRGSSSNAWMAFCTGGEVRQIQSLKHLILLQLVRSLVEKVTLICNSLPYDIWLNNLWSNQLIIIWLNFPQVINIEREDKKLLYHLSRIVLTTSLAPINNVFRNGSLWLETTKFWWKLGHILKYYNVVTWTKKYRTIIKYQLHLICWKWQHKLQIDCPIDLIFYPAKRRIRQL